MYSAMASPPTSSSPSKMIFNVDGQLAVVCLEEGFESFDFHPELAFVVDRAAGIDVVIPLGRLKGRSVPLVEGFGRLDVIMRIHEDGGLAGSVQPVGVEERMAGGLDDLDIIHADAAQFVGDKIGGLLDVGFVLVEGADAGNAEEIFEFLDKAGLVGTREINCRGSHGWPFWRYVWMIDGRAPKTFQYIPGTCREGCRVGVAEMGVGMAIFPTNRLPEIFSASQDADSMRLWISDRGATIRNHAMFTTMVRP